MKERERMEKKIIFIGGSPCSGKSTLAERISKECGAYYYKVDDFLDSFMELATKKGYPVCAKVAAMSPEEIWMRDPVVQCDEEFQIYEEIAEFVFEKLSGLKADFIVTEGAAYTPSVMKKRKLADYLCIVPSPEFQISHYKEREWVSYVLEGCSDKQKAFDNWMQRDILFAKQVKKECAENAIPCIVNDGTRSVDEMYLWVQETAFLQ